MSQPAHESTPANSAEPAVEKMLGALVPEELYWAFKGAATSRKESVKEALKHAARIYIDLKPGEGGET